MSLSLVFGGDQEKQLEPWASRTSRTSRTSRRTCSRELGLVGTSRTSSRELGRGWISERWLIACIVPPSPPVHCVLLRSMCIVHCAVCAVHYVHCAWGRLHCALPALSPIPSVYCN